MVSNNEMIEFSLEVNIGNSRTYGLALAKFFDV